MGRVQCEPSGLVPAPFQQGFAGAWAIAVTQVSVLGVPMASVVSVAAVAPDPGQQPARRSCRQSLEAPMPAAFFLLLAAVAAAAAAPWTPSFLLAQP